MKHLLLILFMLSVAFGKDWCKEIDTNQAIKNNIIGTTQSKELNGYYAKMTISNFGCKNNTVRYKYNIYTNIPLDFDANTKAMLENEMFNDKIDVYCSTFKTVGLNARHTAYYNNASNKVEVTFRPQNCR